MTPFIVLALCMFVWDDEIRFFQRWLNEIELLKRCANLQNDKRENLLEIPPTNLQLDKIWPNFSLFKKLWIYLFCVGKDLPLPRSRFLVSSRNDRSHKRLFAKRIVASRHEKRLRERLAEIKLSCLVNWKSILDPEISLSRDSISCPSRWQAVRKINSASHALKGKGA